MINKKSISLQLCCGSVLRVTAPPGRSGRTRSASASWRSSTFVLHKRSAHEFSSAPLRMAAECWWEYRFIVARHKSGPVRSEQKIFGSRCDPNKKISHGTSRGRCDPIFSAAAGRCPDIFGSCDPIFSAATLSTVRRCHQTKTTAAQPSTLPEIPATNPPGKIVDCGTRIIFVRVIGTHVSPRLVQILSLDRVPHDQKRGRH